jgi:predicted O-methyltransferase YrrM
VDSAIQREPSASGEQVLPHDRHSFDRRFHSIFLIAHHCPSLLAIAGYVIYRRMAFAIHRTLVRGKAAGILPRLALPIRRAPMVERQNSRPRLITMIIDSAVLAVLNEYQIRIEAEANLRKALSRQEWLSRRDEFLLEVGESVATILNLLIRDAGAKTIVEVGTSYGFSTIWLAEAARATQGKVITLDVNSQKQAYSKTMMEKAGLSKYVDYRCGDAMQLIQQMTEKIDFALIDLWKDVYIPCFDVILPKLAPGGIIVADNMIFPPDNQAMAAAYRAHVRSHSGMDSILLPVGHGIEISRRDALS